MDVCLLCFWSNWHFFILSVHLVFHIYSAPQRNWPFTRTIRQSKPFLPLFWARKTNNLTNHSREIAFQWSLTRKSSDHSLLKCVFTTIKEKEWSLKLTVTLRFNTTYYRGETFFKWKEKYPEWNPPWNVRKVVSSALGNSALLKG